MRACVCVCMSERGGGKVGRSDSCDEGRTSACLREKERERERERENGEREAGGRDGERERER